MRKLPAMKRLKLEFRVVLRLSTTTSAMAIFNRKTKWFLLKLTAKVRINGEDVPVNSDTLSDE